MRGAIQYYSNGAPVDAAIVQLQATVAGGVVAGTSVQTDPAGQFSFNSIGGGDWQVQPQKIGGGGAAVAPIDAVYALQAASGDRTFTAEQQMACDVDGNGMVDDADATAIIKYYVGETSQLPAAANCHSDWLFVPHPDPTSNQQLTQPLLFSSFCRPGAISFQPLTGQADDQNFTAILIGDCTGAWQPSKGPTGSVVGGNTGTVVLRTYRQRGRSVRTALWVENTPTLLALDAQVQYDATQMKFRSAEFLGDAHNAIARANSTVPGLIKIGVASAKPLQSGRLVLLNFLAKPERQDPSAVSLVSATVSGE